MWIRSRIFESVRANSVVKWVAWALGGIVIGALGSGLWDVALKPVLVHASYGLMSLSSLGIESFRTTLYERIATGSTARVDLETFGQVTILMFGFFLAAFLFLFLSPDKTYEDPQESEEKTFSRWKVYIAGFMTLLVSGMLMVRVSQATYQTAAVVHFQQVLKIASPYLTDTDRAIVESKFAQINSKAEYVAIMDSLAKTAKEHSQQVPAFNAW